MPDDDRTWIEEIHMSVDRLTARGAIGPTDLRNVEFESYYDHMHDCRILELVKRTLESKHADSWRCSHPATWWDHFKQRWFPAWARMRWPVHFTHHHVTAYVAYPSHRYEVPPSQRTMAFPVHPHPGLADQLGEQVYVSLRDKETRDR